MTRRYRAFGLQIDSDFPIPELNTAARESNADLRIGQQALPEGPGQYHVEVEGEAVTLWVPDARATYRMIAGRELIVHSWNGEIGRGVRLYLLGSAMGAILHQRGLLPLHACTVELGGKAFAFLGRSGAGKSTLAAWLAERGCRLLSDDVSVVREAGGSHLAAMGVPRLRLWRDAIEARGGSVGDYPRSFEDWDKYDLPAPAAEGPDEVELAGLFHLSEGDEAAFTPLSGTEAVEALSANTYRGSYVRLLGRTGEHFERCIGLARRVPVQRFTRPLSFARMEQDYGLLLGRLRQLAG